jgi:hypothetical protein
MSKELLKVIVTGEGEGDLQVSIESHMLKDQVISVVAAAMADLQDMATMFGQEHEVAMALMASAVMNGKKTMRSI